MAGLATLMVLAASTIPPPPPIVITTNAHPPVVAGEQRLLTWHPGEVSCEGGAAPRVITLRRPLNSLSWGDHALASTRFSFAIDGQGRPHSIHREGAARGLLEQAAPALAASRFAAGSPRRECTVTYTARREKLNEASREELASYLLLTRTPALPRAGMERLREGDGCAARTDMQPLVRVYPDLKSIPATPGVPDWTLVGFDVAPDGTPQRVRTLSGTGNAALDAAAVTALAASKFSAGPLRENCVLPFRRPPATLAAPPPLDVSEPEGGPCARTGNWATAPQLRYPQPYRMRAIEGWAVLDYDVAPWGAIGNVRVVEAQPSEDFGFAAKAMIERAKRPEGSGATNCRTRVRYAMAREGTVAPDMEDAGAP